MRQSVVVASVTAVLCLAGLAGCGESKTESTAAVKDNPVAAKVDAKLKAMQATVNAVSPSGEQGQPVSAVDLTDDEIAQIKAKGLKAAIAAHYLGDAHIVAIVKAMTAEFKRLGIELVASTSADFNANTQTNQIEAALALHPDILVSLPVDPVATKGAFEKARDQGVKLVFMDQAPTGFVAGKDYVSVVTDDRISQGIINGLQICKTLNGKGKVGLIFHDADFWITEQAFIGVKKGLEECPGVKIISEKGVVGPDFAGDAQTAANAMLSQNRDINLIWGVWDVPAEGILAAIRAAGRNDVKVVTMGIAPTMSIALMQRQLVEGLTATDSWNQGLAMTHVGAKAALGEKDLPGFIASSVKAVSAGDDIAAQWQESYHAPAPKEIANAQKALGK
jgi:ribose transport system substrate-binding protein